MNQPTRYPRVALPLALLAALLAGQVMVTGNTASAGPAVGGLPSVPGVPLPPVPSLPVPVPPVPVPVPVPPLPTLPVPPPVTPPTAPPGLPGLPGSPGQPGQPGPPTVPAVPPAQPPVAPGSGAPLPGTGEPAGGLTPDAAAAVIAGDPAADLYPQPSVDPVTTAPSLLVARLGEVQHRVQYLRNILIRTRADLAVARARLDAATTLITLLTAPARSGGPQERVQALATAITSGEADLARSESAARSLQQQVNSGVRTNLASGPPVPATAADYGGGRLRRPVPGRITSSFGNRFDPYYHVWQLHAGIDIAASMGTGIVAAAGGRVARAGWNGGYGNYTCIDHGQHDGQRLTTCYGHQSAIGVRPGQQVAAGQLIGRIGSTGASTGPHLHFEVRLGGRPVDPRPWI